MRISDWSSDVCSSDLGAQGWMAARLLSRTRTAIVTGGVRSMRKTASPDAAIVYRAEPGVVGRISDCKPGWCLFDVKGRKGRSEEHTYELQSLMRNAYAGFCLNKTNKSRNRQM